VTSDVTTAWDRGDTLVNRRLQDPNAECGPVENNLHRIRTHFLNACGSPSYGSVPACASQSTYLIIRPVDVSFYITTSIKITMKE